MSNSNSAQHTPGPDLLGYPSQGQAEAIATAAHAAEQSGMRWSFKAAGARGNAFEVSSALDGCIVMRCWTAGIEEPRREKFASLVEWRAAIAKAGAQ